MPELNRRQFVVLAASTAAAAAGAAGGLCGCAGGNAGAEWSGPTDFNLGPAGQFKAGIDSRWATSGGFFVVREGPRVFAVSAICSHKACDLEPEPPNLNCPCHGSRFTARGRVLNGPAFRSLAHFGVSLSAAGELLVDRRKTFDEAHYDDPGSFVTV